MDKLECMKSFVAVAKYKSFTAAARKKGIGVAKVSKQIGFLENLLSVSLFIRTTRKVELTSKGEVFINYAQDIIKMMEQAQNELDSDIIQPRGDITVSITTGINISLFIQYFSDFLSKYPKIKFNMKNSNSPLTVLDGTADISFSSINISDTRIVQYTLGSFKRKLYASTAYLKKHGLPKSLKDLSNHNALVNTLTHPKKVWQFGESYIDLNYNYFSSSMDELKVAAVSGLGIIWSLDVLVKKEVDMGQLIEVEIDGAQVDTKIYCYFLQTSREDKKRLLAEYISKNL